MNKLRFLLIGFVILILGACNSEIDDTQTTTTLPVEDSSMSDTEIADEVIYTFYEYTTKVHQDVFSNNFTDTNKQEYIDLTTEFLNYINSVEPKEMNLTDELLEDYLWDLDYYATKYAEETLNYLTKQDDVNKRMANDYYYDSIAEMELINSILE